MTPFRRLRRLGAGGMGEVWLGEHQPSGLPVAIKTIRPDFADDDRFRDSFQREVHAVARLDHPHIVMVLDVGDDDGAPWLVMEFAAGGALDQRPLPASFHDLRECLLTILDALAHAHARDLLHLDLKPANILVCGADDLRPGLKLTDFGLARLAWERTRGAGGTPDYMAPEQVLGQWRDMGPWTDLYGLGAVAWELATGHPVFPGEKDPRQAHLQRDPPAFNPVVPVPPGFEDWLRQLLAKRPADRFPNAAAAALALDRMDEVLGTPVARGLVRRPSTSTFALTTLRWEDEQDPDTPQPAPQDRVLAMPQDWRTLENRPVHQMVGAGLGLFGIRDVPFVGRDDERERIWEALRQVRERSAAKVLAVRGPGGLGASRLMRWMAWRANEVGAARTLISDGNLPAALVRHHRLEGLDVHNMVRRLDLHGGDAHALAQLLSGLEVDDRVGLLHRALLRMGRQAPLLVVLDDADAEAVAVARRVRREAPLHATPILVLLRAPLRGDGIDLQPLDNHTLGRLLRQLLDLDPSVEGLIQRRTLGNPQFAMALIGDWIQRGILKPGRNGFRLEGTVPPMPQGESQLWDQRLGPLLHRLDDEDVRGLVIGALLGPQVDAAEWRAAAPRASQRAWNLLAVAGLVRRTSAGWTFTSAAPRVFLASRATSDDHAACAQALTGLEDAAHRHERLGRHLLASGGGEEAIEHLLTGARVRTDLTHFGHADALVQEAQAAIDARGLAPDHPLRAEAVIRRIVMWANDWRHEQLLDQADELLHRFTQHWPERLPRLLNTLGRVAFRSGRLNEGTRWATRAVALAERPEWRARALWTLGYIAQRQGRVEDASACFDAAFELDQDDLFQKARYLNDKGEILRHQGQLDQAEQAYTMALEITRELGERDALITELNLGLLSLQRGDIATARERLVRVDREAETRLAVLVLACCSCLLVEVAAHDQDWAAWDRNLGRALQLVERSKTWDPDLADSLERAVTLAQDAGRIQRAAVAKRLAEQIRAHL